MTTQEVFGNQFYGFLLGVAVAATFFTKNVGAMILAVVALILCSLWWFA